MGYSEMCYAVSPNMWRFSKDISVINFYFNSAVVTEHTLYYLNPFKFTENIFMDKNIVYLGKFST